MSAAPHERRSSRAALGAPLILKKHERERDRRSFLALALIRYRF